jgi:hypothetical protein
VVEHNERHPLTLSQDTVHPVQSAGCRVLRAGAWCALWQGKATVLETLLEAVLVEARPETGRKHQVRAHLAGRQMRVLGDARCGGPDRADGVPVPRVMLHAARLAFTHPITAQPVTIECPYPEDFAELLRRLAQAVHTPPR